LESEVTQPLPIENYDGVNPNLSRAEHDAGELLIAKEN
jgi:hypothetical protein